MNTNVTEFHTKDLGLAVSLMTEGITYIRVDNDPDDFRRLFVFEANEEINRIQTQRTNGSHVVSSTHYEECQRRLKTIIHSANRHG